MNQMKYKIIHHEWNDFVIIDSKKNTLYRENKPEESGTFQLIKNILFINWYNWDSEYFIYDYEIDSSIFYKVDKINFHDNYWNDICYIDKFNQKIYKNSSLEVGSFDYLEDNELFIHSWNKYNLHQSSHSNYLNIIYNQNTAIEHKQVEPKNNLNCSSNIPNIIHFVFGFKKQDKEFELYRYLAIKSAIDVNNPQKIYFHYKYEPFGPWWDKIKPYLLLEYTEPPSEIYGNNLYHYAHQADIIRLQKLIKYGGIYLDIDTICLKSFHDLLENKCVMGIQNNKNKSEMYGLCNAIILSEPNSEFLLKWVDLYTSFRSKGRDIYWDEHSVIMPLKLAHQYPELITILEPDAFYNPLWYNINEYLFNQNYLIDNYKTLINHNYCIHLWDTYSHDYLSKLTIESIVEKNTLYNIIARKFLRNQISLVFLTYNRYDMTKKCLESYLQVLDYDYIEELLILDNHSDSLLVDYLKQFEKNHKKIRIIFSKENLGVCLGRIQLFKEVKGDIIASLDSDAYLESPLFFEKVRNLLYDEKYGIIGISGAYLKSWTFGNQKDIDELDENEYYCHHIAGCCQVFRKDMQLFGFELDPNYGKFWVEDTDLSMQSLFLNKINYRLSSKGFINHRWGGSGKFFYDLFEKNWNYFVGKWKHKVLLSLPD